ncbi:MAG: hypothetical protein JWM86_2657 [Thermoleophilia bacterium]|nr:hypothetical protein [Thermoleophilia bacterium]
MNVAATGAPRPGDTKVRDAALAAGGTLAAVSMPMVLLSGMFGKQAYHQSWGNMVMKNTSPYIGMYALPAAAGVGTAAFLGGGAAGIAGGAVAGGVVGGALGASVLHRFIAEGEKTMSRAGTARWGAAAGVLAAVMGATVYAGINASQPAAAET